MVKEPSDELYAKVVNLTLVYFGPTSENFIVRQLENLLHKPPQEITKSDLKSIIGWIRVVVSLITDDDDLVDEYIQKLKKLHQSKK